MVGASGMSRELFRAANAWLGHLPGGMAIATIFACGGFAAISGSSIAAAATMTKVALPEMRRAGYNAGLAAGIVAAGGTLDIMIPPSVLFVLYSILTDTDLVGLFIAGIIPGCIAIVLYCIVILIIYKYKPDWLPRGQRSSWGERFDSLKDVWATLLLFFVVVGGIFTRLRHHHRGCRARRVRRAGDRHRAPLAAVDAHRRHAGRCAAHDGGDLLHRDRRVPVPVFPRRHADVAAAGRLRWSA